MRSRVASGPPVENESLRVDAVWELNDLQQRIGGYDGAAALCVSGPPGSGKTASLAVRAIRLPGDGPVAVICPHAASCEAFRSALGNAGEQRRPIVVDTLAGHFATWMRAEFVASGAAPDLIVGSDVDSNALARLAGRSILDMTWPGFRSADFTL